MPSAEDALAFLASFTVGKEEELRAQAEREGEARMDAIMGGKKGTSPLRPKREEEPPSAVEPAPPPIPEPQPEPIPYSPVGEGMPSAEDALAFLASFTVGKEEELRAQAEREGEARMEAIMGGKPGTSPLRPRPAEPVAELPVEAPAAPTDEVVPEAVAWPEPASEFVETPPEAEAPVEAGEAPTEVAEAPEMAEEMLQIEDNLDFLRSIVSGETEPLVEAVEEAGEVAQPELTTAPVAETVEAPSEIPPVTDFWLQTAADESEEEISEAYFTPAPIPTPAPPPAAARKPAAKKSRPSRRAVERAAAPEPPIAPAIPPIEAEAFVSRLQADPSDYEAQLGMARVWWASGKRDQSLRFYQDLIKRELFLSEVADDLERNLETFENTDWYRALGDTHMKLGNLPQALDAYRQALTHL
jgi:hypothetical protein